MRQRRDVVELPRGHRPSRRGGARAGEHARRLSRRAKALGARWVEFDVQLTGDGVPILMHDETLDRTTDGSGRVSADTTLAQIRRLRCRRLVRPELRRRDGADAGGGADARWPSSASAPISRSSRARAARPRPRSGRRRRCARLWPAGCRRRWCRASSCRALAAARDAGAATCRAACSWRACRATGASMARRARAAPRSIADHRRLGRGAGRGDPRRRLSAAGCYTVNDAGAGARAVRLGGRRRVHRRPGQIAAASVSAAISLSQTEPV